MFNAGDKLDFPDSSFTFVYSEHFFEHLRFDIAVELLQEVARVLAPGGAIRIAVPDSDYRAYEAPEPAGYPGHALPMNHPNKHKTRWNIYLLARTLEFVGLRPVSLVYCNDVGQFVRRAPSEVYAGASVADPDVTHTLRYIQRPKSLIVDGVRGR